MAKSSSTSRGTSSRDRYRHTSVSRSTSASSRRRGPISHRQQGDPTAHRRAAITSRQPSIWLSSVPRSSQPTVHQEEIVRQHEDGREELDHVVMALDVREQGKIGCAYYVAREERLLCMEDVPRGGVETVDRLKVDLQPTVVIVSTRVDALCDQNEGWRLRRQSSLVDNHDENPPLPYQIELRPTPEFSFEGALNKLANIGSMLAISGVKFLVPGDTVMYEPDSQIDEVGLSNRQGRLLQISSWLDLDCKVSISCAGAVMNYLRNKRVSEYLPDDPDAQLAYRIMHMEMFTFKDTMRVTILLARECTANTGQVCHC
jgi:DNA mismatch repair protein MSH5